MTGLALAIWVVLAVVAAGMVLREHRIAEEELDAIVAGLQVGQAWCGDCGDTFPADEVELHYLLRHPEAVRRADEHPP